MTAFTKRVVFTMGGKGGVGKTGVIAALAEWFAANEIPVTLLDLDTENKACGSLKHFFNGTVTKVNIHTPAGLDAFVDHLDGGTPIILADMGAGAGQVAADWFESMYDDVAETGLRFTAVGVVTPDPACVESLRQYFLNSGIPDTVNGLQATSVAMTTAQRELSTTLRDLSDSRGAVAQIESANNRLTYSLESRAKSVDALLHEVKSDLLHIWIPLIAGASLLIGLLGGMAIQSWRDSVQMAPTPASTVAEPVPLPEPQQSPAVPGDPKQQYHRQANGKRAVFPSGISTGLSLTIVSWIRQRGRTVVFVDFVRLQRSGGLSS
jgi:hypothetical protein